jgi:hypothetical protein
MTAAAPPAATRNGTSLRMPPRTMALAPLPPMLVARQESTAASAPARRSKLWEFNTNLHCSILGTCLSTGELRQVMKKLGLAPPESTDHELHGTAVTLAGRHDTAGKLLNKAFDKRHQLAINQFAKADSEAGLRVLWREAVRRGDVPGAYWATLTHAAATPEMVREAFGDVHMLSHLVGAANRADIRRLCQLESGKAALEAKLERQQVALHQAIVARDASIRELRQALAEKIVVEPSAGPIGGGEQHQALHQVIADLERRLASETRGRAAADARLTAARDAVAQECSARAKGEQERDALQRELQAIEQSLAPAGAEPLPDTRPPARLDGAVLLYVGGRANQVAHLRAVGERLGATFLHHDGGIENHPNLLPGLTSRADLVLFPVDCISHDAAHMVKLLCRQAAKRFVPLRSASATSLLAALHRPELIRLADAAD